MSNTDKAAGKLNYKHQLDILRGAIDRLDDCEHQLGTIHAILYVNFVDKKTCGVQVSEEEINRDMSVSQFLELILKKIYNRIEGEEDE